MTFLDNPQISPPLCCPKVLEKAEVAGSVRGTTAAKKDAERSMSPATALQRKFE